MTHNLQQGRQLRDEGMERAVLACDEPVYRARLRAIILARRHGYVTAATLRHDLETNPANGFEMKRNVLDKLSPASWGGLFAGCPKIKKVNYTQSSHVPRHAGIIGVWEYAP